MQVEGQEDPQPPPSLSVSYIYISISFLFIKAGEEEIMMVEEGREAPHGVVLAVVVGVVVAVPFLLGDGAGEAVLEAISELVTPAGLLFLPVTLIFVIRFLSSDRGTVFSDIFSFGSPDSIHRVGGSPIGVALVLLLLLLLLYNRISLFGGDDDSDE